MADEVKPGQKTAQVYRLASVSKSDEVAQQIVARKEAKTPSDAVQGNAFMPEDEYQMLYAGASRDAGLLEPPYLLRKLDRLSQENNTLSPCIEAMVTNIDGTGYDFEKEGEKAENDKDDAKDKALTDFFAQPWPGTSFVTMRKAVRRDVERLGVGYLEVLRNPADEVVFLRHTDGKMMRMIKLDEAVPVEQTMKRNGVEVKTAVMLRERRFCQLLNGVTMVYFREFGTSRDLNKKTGMWAKKGQRLPASERATEIIYFSGLPDAHTPYGVPRWINQIPSVLGSRSAEEYNLDFFEAGGVPPALIILQGGTLQGETRKALEQKMVRGDASQKNRLQVLEVEPSGGSLDQTPQARVTVERFGAERQQDAMFENYDDKCSARIRRAFRLPPIFLGHSEDYSFASASASYQVAEAQVFKPERDEFDEIISMKLLPVMGFPGYRMVSKPLVIENAIIKMQGLQLAVQTQRVDMADVITELNEAAGTNLKVVEAPPMPTLPGGMPLAAGGKPEPGNENKTPGAKPGAPAGPAPVGGMPRPSGLTLPPPSSASMIKSASEGILALASDTLIALRKRDMVSLSSNMALIRQLDARKQAEFQKACARFQYLDPSYDLSGLGELMGCTVSVMGHAGHRH